MVRTIAKYLLLASGVLVISQAIGLAYLWYGLKTYPDYWNGKANQPGEILYVAIGDSAAQGVGASKPALGYVGLIAQEIEKQTGKSVRTVNVSKSGATLGDAIREQLPKLASYDADIVTVEIGANDMRNYNDSTFRRDFETLLQSLPPGKSIVSDMPYFGGRAHSTRNAQFANESIHQLTEKYRIPNARLFDALSKQQSPLIYASDLFHPNNRGYDIWFTAFEPHIVTMAISLREQ